jgi:hypothetical protein
VTSSIPVITNSFTALALALRVLNTTTPSLLCSATGTLLIPRPWARRSQERLEHFHTLQLLAAQHEGVGAANVAIHLVVFA